DRLRRAPDLAGPAAARTRLFATARLCAVPQTSLAGRQARHVDLLLDSRESLLECDGHVVTQVVAAIRALAARAPADAATEERVEDVRERHVREVDGRPSGVDRGVAEHVVGAAAPRI